MLKNAVIIIPTISDEQQVCDFLMQTATILRKKNVVYVLPYFSIPRILPLRRFALIDQLNRILYFLCIQLFLQIKHHNSTGFYWWIFFPQFSLISRIKLFRWKVIFDIVDYHSNPDQAEHLMLEKHKDNLLKRADYIFSISQTLKRLYQPRASKEIALVPQGFALQEFTDKASQDLGFPSDKPVIGFVGQISERIDFELLNKLIGGNPQWNFVCIGPVRHESNVAGASVELLLNKLSQYRNFFYYGSQKRSVVLSSMKKFDVCIIPYDMRYDFNRYCYPMKLFEYFYVGKPVVSTSIEELSRFKNLVCLGSTAHEFAEEIEKLLEKKWPTKKATRQRALALENSWENKLNQMSRLLK